VTYLDVIPSAGTAVVLVDSASGARYVLSRDNAIALAWRLLAGVGTAGRVVANAPTGNVTPPVPPPPIPFTPGPVPASLQATMDANAELERLRNVPRPVPQPTPPPSGGGTSTTGGKQ